MRPMFHQLQQNPVPLYQNPQLQLQGDAQIKSKDKKNLAKLGLPYTNKISKEPTVKRESGPIF